MRMRIRGIRVRKRGKKERRDAAGIDLAPMLDFVMNLLIFFIITAVFAKELSLDVRRPSAGAGPATKEAGSLLVTIEAGGDILIDDRIVDIRAVRANVERMHALKPENGVMIVADKAAGTGLLVQVVDQVRQGGVTNVSFGATR
jgi:biopolymer transport protein ExbD